jgi:hypothetical protein
MAFPVSPTEGQTFTENNTVWIYSAVTGQWNRSVINPLNETLYVFGSASATGAAGEIQYTDGSRLAASPNLVWDDVNDELEVGGDVVLDDGGTFTTTLQTVTPTQNRTISFPDATGTVGLVAGSSGQLAYNNAGAYAGVPSSVIGATGDVTLALNGAASTPPLELTGTWFTGGTSTTTKPQVLIEPAGTTSTAWSTSGTGLGVNAVSGFAGRLIDCQVNGSALFNVENSATSETRIFTSLVSVAGNIKQTGGGFSINGNSVGVRDTGTFDFWSGVAASPSVVDLRLFRDAAGTLAQRNGTSAQKTNIYDTFTSSTDYHRVTIATARATLTNVSGASVTATGLIPAGAVVMGVTSKVTTALGTANGTTGYKIGTAADDDRWGAITGTAAGTTSDNRNWTAGTIECFPSATNVIVTATGGNFNATGVIYLSVQYMAGEAD